MFACNPDSWMQNGIATPLTAEEKAAWPHRLAIFLNGKSGQGCEINAGAKGCADTPLWSGSSDDERTYVALARYRPMVAEPDMLSITLATNTFFGSFDGRAVSGTCRTLTFDTDGKLEGASPNVTPPSQ